MSLGWLTGTPNPLITHAAAEKIGRSAAGLGEIAGLSTAHRLSLYRLLQLDLSTNEPCDGAENAHRQQHRGDATSDRSGGHCGDGNVGQRRGSILARITSPKGFTAISHYFVMDWAMIWIDIVLGLLIAGALSAWVPENFWQAFFLSADPIGSKIVGPLIGPIVAIVSFVCSIGNVPLAAVLWNGGISFGGVIAFLFADLIILPTIDIYRRYYGVRIAALLFGVSYAAMAGAAYIVELIFGVVGLVPQQRSAQTRRGSHSVELHDLA
jgi:hypothetical protein